jgi:hypothetical protein
MERARNFDQRLAAGTNGNPLAARICMEKPVGESIARADSGFLRRKFVPKQTMDSRTDHKKREAFTHNSG